MNKLWIPIILWNVIAVPIIYVCTFGAIYLGYHDRPVIKNQIWEM